MPPIALTRLHPALKRPNLQLVTNALVHRVLFDGKRATGVEFSRGGAVETVEATREIILADKRDGKPLAGLAGKEGPFRIVAPGDKRPARWIRQVASMKVVAVK